MTKAKITLNENHIHNGGWGFGLIDKQGNNYSFHYKKGSLDLPDHIAKQFEGRPDLDIIYSDGNKKEGFKPNDQSKKIPKPKKKHTKTDLVNMSKKEQINLLKKLGVKKIPLLEKGRVKLIMELE